MPSNFRVTNQHKSIVSELSFVVFALTFLLSCEVGKEKESQIPKEDSDKVELSDSVNPDTFPIPSMDSFPFTFSIPYEDIQSFYPAYKNLPDQEFIHYSLEYVDGAYCVTIYRNPKYEFYKDVLKLEEDRHFSELLNVMFKPQFDSLYFGTNRLHSLDKKEALKYFNTSDSLFPVFSFGIDDNHHPGYGYNLNINCHLVCNKTKRSCFVATFDSIGTKLDIKELFVSHNPSCEYTIHTHYQSVIKVFKRNIAPPNQTTGYYRIDSTEVARYYIDPHGKIHTWIDTLPDIQKICLSVPKDSTFKYYTSQDKHFKAPLTLAMEKAILHFKRFHTTTDFAFYETINPDQEGTYFFQYFISRSDQKILFTVKDNNNTEHLLVLADANHQILDVWDLVRQPSKNEDYLFEQSVSVLGKDHTIYIMDQYYTDTLDILKIKGNKISHLKENKSFVNIPYSNLDQYFNYLHIDTIDVDEARLSYEKGLVKHSFPDSILACIKSCIRRDDTSTLGYNYCLLKTSTGLTLWLLYFSGEYSYRINLFVLDTNKVIQVKSFGLSEISGDEGQYYRSYGSFINDTTYQKTSISESEGIGSDSTIQVYRFLQNGKIVLEEDLSSYYKKTWKATY